MNRSLLTILMGVVVASCLASAPASAGVRIRIFPPAPFIATTSPVYYQNHATYRYGNRWHYRHGRRWHTYRAEPRYLRSYRKNHQPQRYFYGPGRR
jgi:hypothetical protein